MSTTKPRRITNRLTRQQQERLKDKLSGGDSDWLLTGRSTKAGIIRRLCRELQFRVNWGHIKRYSAGFPHPIKYRKQTNGEATKASKAPRAEARRLGLDIKQPQTAPPTQPQPLQLGAKGRAALIRQLRSDVRFLAGIIERNVVLTPEDLVTVRRLSSDAGQLMLA